MPHWFIICHCYGWFNVSNIFWFIEMEQLPKKSMKKNVRWTISFVWNGIIFQKMGLYNYGLVYYNTFIILVSSWWLFSLIFTFGNKINDCPKFLQLGWEKKLFKQFCTTQVANSNVKQIIRISASWVANFLTDFEKNQCTLMMRRTLICQGKDTILSWYQSRFNTTKVVRIGEFLEVYMVRT